MNLESRKKFADVRGKRVIEEQKVLIKESVKEDYFGESNITFIDMIKTNERWDVPREDGGKECILNSGFKWLQVFPKNEKYAITGIYDQNKKLVEFYFDMVAGSGIENGVPYILDIYLDLVITGKNSKYVLDEDELQEGLEQNIFSQVEYDEAYNTLDILMKKYETNEELDKLKNVMLNYFDEMYNSLN